ncbi:proteasome subunit beta [Streptomyces aidingensis]|uniref:Proteasome subunit beta n=1 Tax=Streptomyces aidingensis TaxID=910347 RepID=A0A1I1S006_9ACTN|nr:proteasome subunit beta [Streptomyces aidingensis]SFD39642.1 proteasome beta subunit [Streptomyces aidingensis]
MAANSHDQGRLPAAFLTPGSSSFLDFLSDHAPERLPSGRGLPPVKGPVEAPHGTTIVAATYSGGPDGSGGVVVAGDRRATMGNLIAQRDIEKVFPADDYSAVGIAGTAGLAVELVKLFQLELEHFEKVEGAVLSLEGKANRLSAMIRGNLGMAMQGLAVIPLLAGWDTDQEKGRIFSYDVTGGRSEEYGFAAVGSGSLFARGALKKLHREDLTGQQAVTAVIQALYDAADEDSATGGPDVSRRIYPIVTVITEDGFRKLSEAEVAQSARAVLDGRLELPNGPQAPVL